MRRARGLECPYAFLLRRQYTLQQGQHGHGAEVTTTALTQTIEMLTLELDNESSALEHPGTDRGTYREQELLQHLGGLGGV